MGTGSSTEDREGRKVIVLNDAERYDAAVRTEHPLYPSTLGAIHLGDKRCSFRVWGPLAQRVDLQLVAPHERVVPMQPEKHGYHHVTVDGVKPGATYLYRLDGEQCRPDPASRLQPFGVHQASAVIDTRFEWTDATWHGLPLRDYIIYELHVGTFTPQGTFDAAIEHLDQLHDLGVTAVELMPVAQFPGTRNWGYDGVQLFAAQNSYGGPDGLQRLVDACHARGLAVVLDVVYNHLGPEGNYLAEFGPYFTDRHRTPWGAAMNIDGPHSDEVRRFFIENALYWIRDLHIDALRLDAIHAIFDQSARPFLRELADAVRQQGELLNRRVYTIAESNLNDPRVVRSEQVGGLGLDAQWVDDLHHALHTELTGERSGYYQAFHGFEHLVTAFRRGFVYAGQYSPYRKRRHGQPADELPAETFVVCAQNHDQVGNRMLGERLSALASFEQLKLAAGVVLLSPYVPLLFMGEEYGETAPFQFFISHGDPDLVEAVRRGRQAEFAAFRWQTEPPDPQAEATFDACRLNHSLRNEGRHAVLQAFYKTLIQLRKTTPALSFLSRQYVETTALPGARAMLIRRWTDQCEVICLLHFGSEPSRVDVPLPSGQWQVLFDSADSEWQGPGSSIPATLDTDGETAVTFAPSSFVVVGRQQFGSRCVQASLGWPIEALHLPVLHFPVRPPAFEERTGK